MILSKIKNKFIKTTLENDEVRKILLENLKPQRELMSRYRCAMMEIETKFKVLNEEFSLEYDRNPIETIKSRLKSPESLAEKIKNKKLDFTIDNIEKHIKDVAGIRVICSFQKDIYELAHCLLQQDDIILIEEKDYIKNPKSNGYRSLHLIVEVPIFLHAEKRAMKVEVQLRTIAMDFWASVEHKLRYKKNIDTELLEELSSDLCECASISANLDQRMEDIRKRLAHCKS